MKKMNPADLYRLYRRTRATEEHASSNDDLESVESDEFSSDASQIYQNYQRTRTNDHSAQIDIIMQKIEMEKSRSEALSSIERENSKTTTIEQTSSLSSPISALLKFPSRALTWLTGQSGKGGVESAPGLFSRGLPALAMLVLAVVLLPFLLKDQNEVAPSSTLANATGIPASIFHVAKDISPSIDSAGMSALGFSSDSADDTRYFDLGTMVSDVSILTVADALNDNKAIILTLAQFAELETDGRIKQAIDGLLAELAVEPLSEATIAEQINTLNQAVVETDSQTLKTQWFKLGQSVEVIDLAAEYMVDSNYPVPLQDSLTQLRSLPVMNATNKQEELLVELLQELSLFGAVDDPTTSDARKIDRLISRIRVLVK